MRTIFHVDVNSAFLSWSALKMLRENPGSLDLRTVPSAVGGDIETRHGIITAKSIPAGKYGIRTGEPVIKALAKCPGLILVKSDFAAYRMYSSQFIKILKSYTTYVEQASIDEAYLDMTNPPAFFSSGSMTHHKRKGSESGGNDKENAQKTAREIADRIKNELGFTVNIGISTNKFLAKTASDFSKPDKIHTLYPEEIKEKLWPLPIGDLYGCGHATAVKLLTFGIDTIGGAASADLSLLQTILGKKTGAYIHERANGIDNSEVDYKEREAKSYSNEITTAVDITSSNYKSLALPVLQSLCSKVASRLKKDGVLGSTIFVVVKTGNFQRHSRQKTLYSSTNDMEEIYKISQGLINDLLFGSEDNVNKKPAGSADKTVGLFSRNQVIRLIGVGVSNLDNGSNRQMTLEEWARLTGPEKD